MCGMDKQDESLVYVFDFEWENKPSRKQGPLMSRKEFKPQEKYVPTGDEEFALIGKHIQGRLKVTRYEKDSSWKDDE